MQSQKGANRRRLVYLDRQRYVAWLVVYDESARLKAEAKASNELNSCALPRVRLRAQVALGEQMPLPPLGSGIFIVAEIAREEFVYPRRPTFMIDDYLARLDFAIGNRSPRIAAIVASSGTGTVFIHHDDLSRRASLRETVESGAHVVGFNFGLLRSKLANGII